MDEITYAHHELIKTTFVEGAPGELNLYLCSNIGDL